MATSQQSAPPPRLSHSPAHVPCRSRCPWVHATQAVQDAIEFKARYLKGRAQVLSRLDHARRDPRYGAQTYTLGDARLTTAGHLPAPASRGTTEASAGMGVAGRIGGSTAASRAGTAAAPVNKVTETLERLATAQVGASCQG